jgi:hypothetical protein
MITRTVIRPLSFLLATLAILSAILSCTESEKIQLKTQAAQAKQTVLSAGKKAAPPLETKAAIAARTAVVNAKTDSIPLETEGAQLAQTALVVAKTKSVPFQTQGALVAQTVLPKGQEAAQTQVAQMEQTAIAEGKAAAQTQIAHLMETAIGQLPQIQPSFAPPLPQPGDFQRTLIRPFETCNSVSDHTASPSIGSNDIIQDGFSNTSSACDAGRGALNTSLLVFGGNNGNIFKKVDQKAIASAEVSFHFTAPFTGNLRIDAKSIINARVGAAAGGATIQPEHQDILLTFLINKDLLITFLNMANGIISPTYTGMKSEAYIQVEGYGAKQEARTLVGGHGYSASFPTPLGSQSEDLAGQEVNVMLTLPVKQGQAILISTGIITQASAYGWAMAYWNPDQQEECLINQVVLTQVK